MSWLRATERGEGAPRKERDIEEAFQEWLWDRFAGGMGRHLERQRAIAAGKGDASPAREQERDRAMMRAMHEATNTTAPVRETPDDAVYNANRDDDDRDEDDDELPSHSRVAGSAQIDPLVCEADARTVPTPVQDIVDHFSVIASTDQPASTTTGYTNWRLFNHPTLAPDGRPRKR